MLASHQFNGFLACAQHESYTGGGAVEEVPLQVYLMNGQRFVITTTDAMQTQHLLQVTSLRITSTAVISLCNRTLCRGDNFITIQLCSSFMGPLDDQLHMTLLCDVVPNSSAMLRVSFRLLLLLLLLKEVGNARLGESD